MMMTLLQSLAGDCNARSVLGRGASSGLVGSVLSSEEGLSRLVKLKLGDFTVGWVNWDWHLGAVLLISDNLLNVDAPSSSVDSKDLSGFTFNSAFLGSSLDENGVSLSHWDGSAVPLASEFLAQMAGHHLSSDAAWSGEVSLSGLSSLAGNTYNKHG